MRIFTVITLLLYWSVMIMAPVIAKEKQKKAENFIYPEKKPKRSTPNEAQALQSRDDNRTAVPHQQKCRS